MDYLPVFLDLRGRIVLVVGAGTLALRKIELLIAAGARVRVVAPRLHPDLETRFATASLAGLKLEILREEFAPHHLDGMSFVVAATGNPAVNQAAAAAGAARGLFVNAVDDVDSGSCQMPAIVDRSPLIVAVGSGGQSPTLASRVRAQIEALLPDRLRDVALVAGRWRVRVRESVPDLAQRRRFWDRFFDSAAAFTQPTASGDAAPLDTHIARALADARAATPRGEVWLIGAGPGDPDLLTLRAQHLLQQCDVVLYDRLVSEAVLARVRRDAQRVFVGKESGAHRTTQARIHELLLEYASRGLRVARLKGGDPLVFGRGGEEIAALAAAQIPLTVVPGVTAALGAASLAGIPLTHRGVSQCVTFVTAMGEAAELLDWRALGAPLQTAVFYMGVALLPRIVDRLRAHGAPAERAVAIVERATLPGQRLICGTLADIVQRAADAAVGAPALLIVGDVVHHRAPAQVLR
jgi:uroporphyrin-III C-methyltransferase/precorrin-2 dehydrogenase/sirohydrochlorin ferrochelatase